MVEGERPFGGRTQAASSCKNSSKTCRAWRLKGENRAAEDVFALGLATRIKAGIHEKRPGAQPQFWTHLANSCSGVIVVISGAQCQREDVEDEGEESLWDPRDDLPAPPSVTSFKSTTKSF